MDGTTLPTPSPGFMDLVIKEFIVPTVPGSYTGVPVTTPEQVVGINKSITDGAANLEAVMAQQSAGQQFVVFGYSQSTMITSLEKARLEEKKARGEPVPNVVFVGIGGGDWPNGSITSRLDGLVVPIIDFTFTAPPPSDPAYEIPSIRIARQYDGFADTPQFVTNPVAVANSLLGALFVHGLYGQEVSLDPDSPKYQPGTIVQQDGLTTYYWIPTQDLPLFDPPRLAGLPEPVIDVFEPFFTELVEAGYDRSIPFSARTPAQLIPVIDPMTLTIKLAAAGLEGANNAAKIAGGELPGYAPLAHQLAAMESQSAAVIGAPYRNQVTAFNEAVNPIETFIQFEAPVAERLNRVTNGFGVPTVSNQILGATLFPVSAWAEHNILTPQEGAPIGPFAATARQFLKRVAPNLDAESSASTEGNTILESTRLERDASDRPGASDSIRRGAHRPTSSPRRPAALTRSLTRVLHAASEPSGENTSSKQAKPADPSPATSSAK
ncbi:MAG: PE-PPE domain-containing protein [Mycobacterium sp.]